MEIIKVFSDYNDEERYYSVLLTEDEVRLFGIIPQSVYDQVVDMSKSSSKTGRLGERVVNKAKTVGKKLLNKAKNNKVAAIGALGAAGAIGAGGAYAMSR